MTTPRFDYAQIRADWETLPTLHIGYADDERGWAKRLDAAHVCLANLPLTAGLCFMDICTLAPRRGREPVVAVVVQRAYHQQALVRYACPDALEESVLAAQVAVFSRALHAAGCLAEGMVRGLCLVNAPEDCDVVAVVQKAALAAGWTIVHVEMCETDTEER
jgi:hypothetical protein